MAIRRLADVSDGTRIFVDTNILIYHLLEDELYGNSCRNFFKRIEEGSILAFTSPIVASETLFIYLRAWIIQNKKIAPKRVLRYLKRASPGTGGSGFSQTSRSAFVIAVPSHK